MEHIIKALSQIRINPVSDEYVLQAVIASELCLSKIKFKREYKLGSRNRVDFITGDGFVIEVKKGKPNKTQVIKQLHRYAAFDKVKGIILVVEKNLDVPKEINGKPCISFGLNKLWGIAL